jgi:phosphoribosylaminoimidazolecarboxamide formyltransferase/IMP cyclohydrolase
MPTIKRALISVSNKKNILPLAEALQARGIEIISTGGTAKFLQKAGIAVSDVSQVTQFPEIMDGRVKTLHPAIHGGILGLRDKHADTAAAHNIQWIDLVVVNLYPFQETIAAECKFEEALEQIDIGGPTLLRAAAKNFQWVNVLSDPADYADFIQNLNAGIATSLETRQAYAAKAFQHTAFYDQAIANYFKPQTEVFPDKLHLVLEKDRELRYGENPEQAAAAYRLGKKQGLLAAHLLQGIPLSFNNFLDLDAASNLLNEFSEPTAVIIKHGNPCGVATAATLKEAFNKAHAADPLSAFGGILAVNGTCDEELAMLITATFFEAVIACDFTEGALLRFSAKPNLRILKSAQSEPAKFDYKFINGGVLVQANVYEPLDFASLACPTTIKPTAHDLKELAFAWRVVKHMKSNAILLSKNFTTVGVGAGQVSRIAAVEIALHKANTNAADTVLATDAFFPFRDSIDCLKDRGVRAIIQPGGSKRDQDVILACNELKIAMIFTGFRCFKH